MIRAVDRQPRRVVQPAAGLVHGGDHLVVHRALFLQAQRTVLGIRANAPVAHLAADLVVGIVGVQ